MPTPEPWPSGAYDDAARERIETARSLALALMHGGEDRPLVSHACTLLAGCVATDERREVLREAGEAMGKEWR